MQMVLDKRKRTLLDDEELMGCLQENSQKGTTISMNDMLENKIVDSIDYYYTQSVTALVAGMSHELKSPLQSIRGAMEIFDIILNKDEIDYDGLFKVYEIIEEQRERINDIIKAMSLCGKELNSNNIELINLNNTIEEIITVFETRNEFKTIEATIVPYINKDIEINTIPSFIFHILTNLLSNSCNSIKKKGEEGMIKITCFKSSSDLVCVEVSDNGVGIDNEEFEKIFRPFYSHRMSEDNSGLGLFIAKAMANRLGGNIYVKESGAEITTMKFCVIDMKGNK